MYRCLLAYQSIKRRQATKRNRDYMNLIPKLLTLCDKCAKNIKSKDTKKHILSQNRIKGKV